MDILRKTLLVCVLCCIPGCDLWERGKQTEDPIKPVREGLSEARQELADVKAMLTKHIADSAKSNQPVRVLPDTPKKTKPEAKPNHDELRLKTNQSGYADAGKVLVHLNSLNPKTRTAAFSITAGNGKVYRIDSMKAGQRAIVGGYAFDLIGLTDVAQVRLSKRGGNA